MVRKGNREAIAGSASISVAFTGVLYLVTDLVFGTGEAIVVAVAFFAFIAWRWWVIALYRTWLDPREGIEKSRSLNSGRFVSRPVALRLATARYRNLSAYI